MTSEIDARTLAGLERQYPGSPWDVVCGVGHPCLPVCMPYPALDVAWAALRCAGFRPARIGVSMAHWDGPYDFTTAMRLEDREARGVVLIRRIGS